MGETRGGGLELLAAKHLDQVNPFGQPVIGWKCAGQCERGFVNPRGFALMWGVVTKSVDPNKPPQPLYEQPMLFENPGAIIIAQCGDKVGLVRSLRMTGERLADERGGYQDYVNHMQQYDMWEDLFATLGRWSWEAPRGLLLPSAEIGEIRDLVVRTAKLEAEEEAGYELADIKIVGRVNANTTFFAHSQYVVHARIVAQGKNNPEDLEMIGGTKLFSMSELRELANAGEFEDGLTLSALALCGLALPPA